MELIERMAWYSYFTIAGLYLTGNINEGALGLTHEQAGTILGVVPFFLYFVPLVTGTIGEKIGYKRMLLSSFVVLGAGYYLCSTATGYWSFFGYFMLVALGAGMFKPIISATIGQTTKESNEKRSVGYGIFYAVVNLGGVFGPIIAGTFRPVIDEATGEKVSGNWDTLFYIAAGYMVVMFFWALFFFKEPQRQGTDPLGKKLREMVTDLRDPKLSILLLILVGYWTNYVQFFNTMSLWITEWADTSALAALPFIPHAWTSAGQLKAEYLINLNGVTIVCLSVWLTSITAKYRILKTMNTAILILCLSVAALAFTSPVATGSLSLWLLMSLIIVFSSAEICVNPKSNELMAKIAPPDKVATYQGYMFLSVAGGFFLGGKLVGLYGHFANKVAMYRNALTGQFSEVPDIETMNLTRLGVELQNRGIDLSQLDQQLWADYKPYLYWLICAGIGITSVILLAIYRRAVPKLEETSRT
ncbi:MFS transporter [Patescibacteria group bacterium]|nr:MFS transporter [Patescibacteria group bacterium]